jgi:prolipoprotein diacylglyceryltransferase
MDFLLYCLPYLLGGALGYWLMSKRLERELQEQEQDRLFDLT